MNFSFPELFIYFGGLLGLIMTLVILIKMKGENQIRSSLSVYLFFGAVSILTGAFNSSANVQFFPYLLRLDSPLHYLYGPFAFYYTYASLKPGFKFRKIYLLHLIPFLVNFIEFCPLYFSSAELKLEYYENIREAGTYAMPVHYVLKAISAIIYLICQVYFFFRFRSQYNLESVSNMSLINWFRIYLFIQGVMISVLIMKIIWPVQIFTDPYHLYIMMVSVLVIATSVALMFFPSLLYGIQEKPEKHAGKYYFSTLRPEEKADIFNKLSNYLSNHDKPFTDPEISLPGIARALNISINHLSQVINEMAGTHFNDYINAFRIEEAKQILRSEDYKRLTIDAIAMKAGFRSKTPFYRAFKEYTGMTPKQYLSIDSPVEKP
jgi:AraC-like DNA-binding protein